MESDAPVATVRQFHLDSAPLEPVVEMIEDALESRRRNPAD
jgi:hypothetical protein